MIYVDNAATTAVHPDVLAAMLPYFSECYANPSGHHTPGRQASEAVADARARIARRLGCEPREVIFTASGSEADNQALRTAVAWGERHGRNHVVTSAFEHPAILRTLQELQSQGIEHTLVAPGPDGIVDPDSVAKAVRESTCLVSVMAVNNEVGTVQPIAQISRIAHDAGAPFHTDAVQGAGHIPLDMASMGIDMLSLSAHKFHGPKGIGALACRETFLGEQSEPVSVILGAGQERGRRAGTENVPGIVGLACALDEACEGLERDAQYVGMLRDTLIHEIVEGPARIDGAHLMGDRARRNPGTVNICFEGVNREALVVLLDRKGVAASAGAACAAGAVGISPVLKSMGVPTHIAAGALRISLCPDNTEDEIRQLVIAIRECVEELRSIAGEEDS